MKISHVLPFLSRGGTAPARPPGPPGTSAGPASTHHVPEAEVVQLTLSHDGIWHVPATPASDTSFTRPAPRRTFQPPRLAPSGGQRYAPTGRLQASALTPGLLLDIYI